MNWNTLTALNEIYHTGKTRKKPILKNDPHVMHLLTATKELIEDGKFILATSGYNDYYERHHAVDYPVYKEFLQKKELLKPQTRFEENDIKVLIDISERLASGDLIFLRDQIIKSNETVRGISLMFFRNEKYLQKHPSLIEALKIILDVKDFADDRDQQYKYVLECEDPKLIVLCENIDFLKKPTKPRESNIELWYAGGKNIEKLKYADTRDLPIYYSCDWDYDGLMIYKAVKQKIPLIKLLYPTGSPRNIITSEHNSLWKFPESPENISGLNQNLFNVREIDLIKRLIQNNSWIIEESNDLVEMLKSNSIP